MSSFCDIPAALVAPFTTYVLQTHPNTFALNPTSDIPPNLHYTSVLREYLAEDGANDTSNLPPHVAHLISSVRRVQLPRTPLEITHVRIEDAQRRYPRLSQGMSPKKAHEVSRMAAYIFSLVQANGLPMLAPDRGSQRLHIVDVGAGQGYLTRALRALLPQARILALDADHAQLAGAVKWEGRLFGKDDETGDESKQKADIQHRTVLIGAEGDTEELRLRKVISEWVQESQVESTENESSDREQAPVLFVALHACGSLTPALLRAFLASYKSKHDEKTNWRPAGVVAVGCCYNLMNPTDFPLSTTFRAYEQSLDLPPSAFHLAAQIPGTWLAPRTGQDRQINPCNACNEGELKVAPVVGLAIRKVVWRALLEHALKTSRPMTDEELRLVDNKETLGAQTAHTSASLGDDQKKQAPDSLEVPDMKQYKKAKKLKKDMKEKKPSATVPARWQRRPENWELNVNDELDEASIPSTPLPTPQNSAVKSNTAAEPLVQVQPQDHSAPSSGIGATPALRRLGRLRDSAYTANWESFLQEAGARMGVVFEGNAKDELAQRKVLETQLETLHVLRCIVGPAIESAILRDRQEWVRETLSFYAHHNPSNGKIGARWQQELLKVELVNLFDQQTGSGRNVAIVISPYLPSTSSSCP